MQGDYGSSTVSAVTARTIQSASMTSTRSPDVYVYHKNNIQGPTLMLSLQPTSTINLVPILVNATGSTILSTDLIHVRIYTVCVLVQVFVYVFMLVTVSKTHACFCVCFCSPFSLAEIQSACWMKWTLTVVSIVTGGSDTNSTSNSDRTSLFFIAVSAVSRR